MKKILIICLLLYFSIFSFLHISKNAELNKPMIRINETTVNYNETAYYSQTIIPFLLETKNTSYNRKESIINEFEGNDFVFDADLDEGAKLTITLNEQNIYNGIIPNNIAPLLEKDGVYKFVITEEKNSSIVNYQKNTYEFYIKIKKKLSCTISSAEVKRGSYLTLSVENVKVNDSVYVETPLKNRTKSYYIDDTLFIYYMIPFEYKKGLYPLKIYNHGELVEEYDINVFANDGLEKRKINKTKYDFDIADTKEIRDILFLQPNQFEFKNWDTYFEWPVSGEIIRDYNDEIIDNNETVLHQGIDIKQAKGTPVKNIADGKVIYSGKTKLLGNFIIIDHGHSLRSYYGHLESIHVKENDMVLSEMTIGTVGEYNNQAFLHFAISLGDELMFIDPWTFLKK